MATKDPAERRRQLLDRNGQKFVQDALVGYRTLGRGVLVIHEVNSTSRPNETVTVYVDGLTARLSHDIPLDEKTLQWLHTYDPSHEFVVIIVAEHGSPTSYRVQFKRNTTMSA